jgi:hypothetical protein
VATTRFDDLTKELAAAKSRRQALRILAAGAAGGMLSLFGPRQAAADHNAQCRDLGDNCRSNAECCGGGVCVDFHCVCPRGTVACQDQCVPVCTPSTNPCRRNVLNPNTCRCESQPVDGAPCSTGRFCDATGICRGGTCQTATCATGRVCSTFPFRACRQTGANPTRCDCV